MCSYHVTSIIVHCVVVGFSSDVTACPGGEAIFSCFVQFTSGTPSGASWIRDSLTNASSLPHHMLFDNSSSSNTLPAIVNNTLLITNVSSGDGTQYTYVCQQGDVMSDSATLTISGEQLIPMFVDRFKQPLILDVYTYMGMALTIIICVKSMYDVEMFKYVKATSYIINHKLSLLYKFIMHA